MGNLSRFEKLLASFSSTESGLTLQSADKISKLLAWVVSVQELQDILGHEIIFPDREALCLLVTIRSMGQGALWFKFVAVNSNNADSFRHHGMKFLAQVQQRMDLQPFTDQELMRAPPTPPMGNLSLLEWSLTDFTNCSQRLTVQDAKKTKSTLCWVLSSAQPVAGHDADLTIPCQTQIATLVTGYYIDRAMITDFDGSQNIHSEQSTMVMWVRATKVHLGSCHPQYQQFRYPDLNQALRTEGTRHGTLVF